MAVRSILLKLMLCFVCSECSAILSLMIFMINNLEHFTFNYSIYKRSTRHGRNLHVPQSHLAMRQKGVHCMSIKIFNSLPDYLIDLVHDKNSL
jgi:hypothetical protein